MFDGFRSRWTRPARWAWWAASAIGIRKRRDLRGRQPLGFEQLGEVAPLDVLEDHENPELVQPADVVDRHDRRMAQPRGVPSLGQERLDLLRSSATAPGAGP